MTALDMLLHVFLCAFSSRDTVYILILVYLYQGLSGVTELLGDNVRFRICVYFFVLVHELAHLMGGRASKLWMCKTSDRGARGCGKVEGKRAENAGVWRIAKADTNAWDLLKGCFPCCPIFGLLDPQVMVPTIGKDRREKAVAYALVEWAGVVASFVMAWACGRIKLANWGGMESAGYFVALFCTTSDYVSLFSIVAGARGEILSSKWQSEQDLWRFCCGNFGLLVAADGGKDGRIDCVKVLWNMVRLCAMRGAQSGGISAIMDSEKHMHEMPSSFRTRVACFKREDLTKKLMKKFIWDSWIYRVKNLSKPWTKNMESGIFMGHTRFATSSIPQEHESHPHHFSPPRTCTYWSVNAMGTWTKKDNAASRVMVTHNGDFEFYSIFDAERTFGQIQEWLPRVLDADLPASCDSTCIAGLMELLRTKGLWPQSLRLAYQHIIAKSFEESIIDLGNEDSSMQEFVDLEAQTFMPKPPAWKDLKEVGEIISQSMECAIKCARDQVDCYDGSSHHSILSQDSMTSINSHYFGMDACYSGLATILDDSSVQNELIDSLMGILEGLAGKYNWVRRVLASGMCEVFIRTAFRYFKENDTLWATRHFMRRAKGSFGMAVSSNLDPDAICLASLGQTISVSFYPEAKLVLYSSEPQVSMIDVLSACGHDGGDSSFSNGWRNGYPKQRLDLNSSDGEICLITVPSKRNHDFYCKSGLRMSDSKGVEYCHIQLLDLKTNEILSRERIDKDERLIDMVDNHYISFQPSRLNNGKDMIAQDLADVPGLINSIHYTFREESAFNRQTAEAFYEQLAIVLDRKMLGKVEVQDGYPPPFDLIITGIETSLWVAEQFAADLQIVFPRLNVTAISANKLIAVAGNCRGIVAPTGFSFTFKRGSFSPNHTIALCISHSGQTFPTLHAAKILGSALPGRVFTISGSYDTQLGTLVGHKSIKDKPFCRRLFSTNSGWRGSEPASITVVGTHHLMTELLVFCAKKCIEDSRERGIHSSLSRDEMKDFCKFLGQFATKTIRNDILAVDGHGRFRTSETNKQLIKVGHKWSYHILEGAIAWIMSACYILGTVISGKLPFYEIGIAFGVAARYYYIFRVLDALAYIWIWHISCIIQRLLTQRDVMARFGKRTLIVCDIPFVHQTLENFVSKMFSLSYGIASLDVHGCNPSDHFLHRFTHRVTRGVLIAAGRPDGRLCSQSSSESAVLLALTQAHMIRNKGSSAEILSIGYNPYKSALAIDHSVVLPSNRSTFLCEAILEADSSPFPPPLEPSLRRANLLSIFEDAGKQKAPVGHIYEKDLKTTGDTNSNQIIGSQSVQQRHLSSMATAGIHRHGSANAFLAPLGFCEGQESHQAEEPHGGIVQSLEDLLEGQSQLESLLESRIFSMERLLAFQVMFYYMAKLVSRFWPLNFDITRSQSGLRVCTTAGPVSAGNLTAKFEETRKFHKKLSRVSSVSRIAFSEAYGSNI